MLFRKIANAWEFVAFYFTSLIFCLLLAALIFNHWNDYFFVPLRSQLDDIEVVYSIVPFSRWERGADQKAPYQYRAVVTKWRISDSKLIKLNGSFPREEEGCVVWDSKNWRCPPTDTAWFGAKLFWMKYGDYRELYLHEEKMRENGRHDALAEEHDVSWFSYARLKCYNSFNGGHSIEDYLGAFFNCSFTPFYFFDEEDAI